LFIDAFGIDRNQEGIKISRTPSATEVQKLTEQVMHLWPKDWREQTVEERQGFNILLWANQTPSTVAKAIARCSLYADHVFICNPCTSFMLYHPQQSPLIRPDVWVHDYALSAVFLALVRPWIEADIVELVQNPITFDVELFSVFRRAAEERFARQPALHNLIDEVAHSNQMLGELLIQNPSSEWEAILSLLPLSQTDRAEALKAAQNITAEDPVRAAIPEWLNFRPASQILPFGSGLSYDQAVAVAAGRNAQIVTHEEINSRELQLDSEQLTGSLQQAAQSLASVPLGFLNNVTPKFAIELRNQGRLVDFRQYISGLARGIQFRNTSKQYSQSAEVEFCERFECEYRRYREEWEDIQRKLATGAVAGAVSTAGSGAAAYLNGNLAIFGVLATAASAAMVTAINGVFDRRKLDRQPLGIVLKLDRGSR
jgi:hypothetical protein